MNENKNINKMIKWDRGGANGIKWDANFDSIKIGWMTDVCKFKFINLIKMNNKADHDDVKIHIFLCCYIKKFYHWCFPQNASSIF